MTEKVYTKPDGGFIDVQEGQELEGQNGGVVKSVQEYMVCPRCGSKASPAFSFSGWWNDSPNAVKIKNRWACDCGYVFDEPA